MSAAAIESLRRGTALGFFTIFCPLILSLNSLLYILYILYILFIRAHAV